MQIVSYGAGTNSTAMVVEMVKRGEIIDLITFADTGGELPDTYLYVGMFSEWLTSKGYPPVTRVKKGGSDETLEQVCIRLKQLPSVAYGYKTCSQRFKIEPQDKHMNNCAQAREVWAGGDKVIKCVGYDAGEPHRAKQFDDKKYRLRYPLIEWDMGRDECVAAIEAAGLPLPGKSSCFFCPNRKPAEVLALPDDLKRRAMEMEANATLTSIKGLGRRWSWTELIHKGGGTPAPAEIELPCGCYDGD